MIKKCIGCGITLQDNDINELGYTTNIDNAYCMRCFKLIHYNELIDKGININNRDLLSNINISNFSCLFLVDFLSISEEIINTYNKILNDKMLLITKSDLIPKNIKIKDLINNIKNVYKIKEEINVVNVNSKTAIKNVERLCKSKRKVILCGYTNAGKSSLINKLINSKITVSNKLNTTQDFMEFNSDEYKIIDTPGFMSNNYFNIDNYKKCIKPITYQLKPIYYLDFNVFNLYVNNDSNVTIYTNGKVRRYRLRSKVDGFFKVEKNTDLVIKGMGFIRFSNDTYISIDLNDEYYELRPSIIGGPNE